MPSPSKYFPPAEAADAEGLILFGGSLSSESLLDAYRHGIFPWPIFDEPELLAWWSPDPRAVMPLDTFHVPRRLRRTCRSGEFRVSCNVDFAGVIHGCATADDRSDGTWLTEEMIDAYQNLHALGHAHSIEAWHDDQLVGGTYGIAMGGLFAAESKFYRRRDASKVALVALTEHLVSRGYQLFDIQQLTEHSEQFGATEIARAEYLARLDRALGLDITFGDRLQTSFA